MRERTVPTGTPSAAAISSYDSSSQTWSKSASRSPAGSAAMPLATRAHSPRASIDAAASSAG
jgi:hypothetical protein